MKRLTSILPIPGLLMAGVLIAAPAWAQQEEEGPGRGVARLSLMNGDVSVQRGDSGDWVAATINAPLLAEDRLTTGPGSRAEVQFDYHHRVRLAPESEIRLVELEWRKYLLHVVRGTVTFTALPGGDAQVEVATPGAAVRPMAHGAYRVSVLPDGTAEITVRRGEAEIFTPRGSQRLGTGRTMMVRPDANGGPEFTMVRAIERDAWDQFNEARDRDLRRAEGMYQRYVSRDIYGAEDLDGHGTWVHVPPYGYVWRPFVGAGWAPYQAGRWTWLDWYGWTWVSHDPWGWAPYHYGRWFMHAGNWCWFPGAYGGRHFWRPALVGWIGFGGPNWGVGLGFGRVGWVPLAPFEPFHPWWGGGMYRGFRGGNFVQNNVTIINNTNVTNIYRNARVRDAVTVIDGNDFRRGFHNRAGRADANELRNANLVRGALPVSPERSSLRFTDREVTGRSGEVAARATERDRMFTSREVARVERVPFEEQRRAFTATGREAGRETGGFRGRETAGEANAATGGATGAGSGWRRFGDPRGTAAGGETPAAATAGRGERTNVMPSRSAESTTGSEPRSGWRRFGDPGQGARIESGRTAEAPARGWSTGSGREAGTSGRFGGSRNEEAVTERPGREATGSGWSTGGSRETGTSGRFGGTRTERPEATGGRWSTGGGREGAPATERGAGSGGSWSTGNGSTGTTRERSEPRFGGSGSERGGSTWSTGGGRERNEPSAAPRSESPRSESPRFESPRSSEPSRGWSTGGGRERSTMSDTPRSMPSESRSGGGRWSSGSSGRSEPRMSGPSFGGGSTGSVRSAPSGGFGGFGGGGGGGVRSAPSGPSFGGGGGGMRSGPSSQGGGGRVSGRGGRND